MDPSISDPQDPERFRSPTFGPYCHLDISAILQGYAHTGKPCTPSETASSPSTPTFFQHVEATTYFSLTNSSLRTWIVNPMGTAANPLPIWGIFASIIPAIFVGILVYAEVEIIE